MEQHDEFYCIEWTGKEIVREWMELDTDGADEE